MDRYESVRALPFDLLAGALGIDISKFRQRKGGTEWAGSCPVHNPKKNSTAFSYNVDGRWACFSCSAKGKGAIDLAMQVRDVGFQVAVEILEPFVAQSLVRDARLPRVATIQVTPAENRPFKSTYEKFAVESEWLKARGFTDETLGVYRCFQYDNPARKSAYGGSVMIKISRWSDGECVGYLSRNIGEATPEKPKYRFPDGLHKSLELFGAWQLKERAPLRIVYLVESPFSVMRFHQLGFPAVSPFGWSVSERQAEVIGELARGVVCLPDRDKAEAFGACAHLLARRMWVKCPVMPEGIDDPESLTEDQIRSLA